MPNLGEYDTLCSGQEKEVVQNALFRKWNTVGV